MVVTAIARCSHACGLARFINVPVTAVDQNDMEKVVYSFEAVNLPQETDKAVSGKKQSTSPSEIAASKTEEEDQMLEDGVSLGDIYEKLYAEEI